MTGHAIINRINQIVDYPTMDDWSRGFCESVTDQINRGRKLSEKQMDVLTRIFDQNTEEAVQELSRWPDEYKNSWSQKAEILAHYYSSTPYYSAVVSDILAGLTPKRHQFLNMVNNKYATKVLTEATKPPKFIIGDYVVGNAACGREHLIADDTKRLSDQVHADFRLRGGFVIEISNLVKSAAKGAKRYRILPVGSTIAFWVEERRLKKAPKPKS